MTVTSVTSFTECIELALKGRKVAHREASMEPVRFDSTRAGDAFRTRLYQETATRPGDNEKARRSGPFH